MEEHVEPIELKETIEPTELKECIEEHAEAHDECTLIGDAVDTEEEDAKSEAYDECKQLTNVGNKVRNNVGRQKLWTSLTISRHKASPNSSTHDDDEAGFAVGTTFGAAVGTTVLSSTYTARRHR
jgi:hypothetical protein